MARCQDAWRLLMASITKYLRITDSANNWAAVDLSDCTITAVVYPNGSVTPAVVSAANGIISVTWDGITDGAVKIVVDADTWGDLSPALAAVDRLREVDFSVEEAKIALLAFNTSDVNAGTPGRLLLVTPRTFAPQPFLMTGLGTAGANGLYEVAKSSYRNYTIYRVGSSYFCWNDISHGYVISTSVGNISGPYWKATGGTTDTSPLGNTFTPQNGAPAGTGIVAYGIVNAYDTTGRTIAAAAAAALDQVSMTPPTSATGFANWTFRQLLVMLGRLFFGPAIENGSQRITYADNGTTAITTQTIGDDGTTQIQGKAP